jgi:hypothetical protein
VLLELLQDQIDLFRAAPDEARALTSSPGGEVQLEPETAVLAAWTMVASTLLNLDEMMTRT